MGKKWKRTLLRQRRAAAEAQATGEREAGALVEAAPAGDDNPVAETPVVEAPPQKAPRRAKPSKKKTAGARK